MKPNLLTLWCSSLHALIVSLLSAAVIQSMKPNVNKALGPYCTFDPVTGIGMAGDWFVEVHVHAKMSGCRTGLTPTSMRVDLHMKIRQMHHRSKPTHMCA
jgi:hypothetical protein